MTKQLELYPVDYYVREANKHYFSRYYKFNQTTNTSFDKDITTANVSPTTIDNDVSCTVSGDPYALSSNSGLRLTYTGGVEHTTTVESGLSQDFFEAQHTFVNNPIVSTSYNQVKAGMMRNVVGVSFLWDYSGSHDDYPATFRFISLGYIDANRNRQMIYAKKYIGGGNVSGHSKREYMTYFLDDADMDLVMTREYKWTSVFASVRFKKDFLTGTKTSSGTLFNVRPIIKSTLDSSIAAGSTEKAQWGILKSNQASLQQEIDRKYVIHTSDI